MAMAAFAAFRARPTLGFSDCLSIEVARKAGHLPLGASTALYACTLAGVQRL